MSFRTVYWSKGRVILLDQRLLPHRVRYLRLSTVKQVAKAIKDMAVRGAPAIGVTAAFGLALAASKIRGRSVEDALERMEEAAELLRSTRPTAVNLFWAIDRVMRVAERCKSVDELRKRVLEEALRILEEDLERNRSIGRNGARLIDDGDTILTHCNAGALATAGYGTALGVIRAAVEEGKKIRVYASETRPRLQGAKLTVWELMKDGIPVKLITDNMAAFLMQRGEVDKVVVGADRVLAKTGHVINKIGTLSHAIAANRFGIPFIVAAPTSTIDFERTPEEVEIEERDPREVLYVGRERVAPKGVEVWNPAFDITPPDLITYIVTERGVHRPWELEALLGRAGEHDVEE